MLAKPNRLRKAYEIDRVYRRGLSANAQDFGIKVLRNNLNVSRIVVVVGKKVSKKAVIRNRIRRRLNAQLESMWQTVAPGYDIVIGVRNDCSEVPESSLKSQLKSILVRTKLTE